MIKYDENFFDNLDEDLEISATDLDIEWVRQPQLFMRYSMASAHFKKLANEASERVKIVEAELKADAADDPVACLGSGVKPSNEKIAAYAKSHPDYEAASKRAVEAQYRADMADNAVFAFHQRKAALENLVRLAGMEYFAGPQESRSIDRDFGKKARQRAAAESVSNARAKRRRS